MGSRRRARGLILMGLVLALLGCSGGPGSGPGQSPPPPPPPPDHGSATTTQATVDQGGLRIIWSALPRWEVTFPSQDVRFNEGRRATVSVSGSIGLGPGVPSAGPEGSPGQVWSFAMAFDKFDGAMPTAAEVFPVGAGALLERRNGTLLVNNVVVLTGLDPARPYRLVAVIRDGPPPGVGQEISHRGDNSGSLTVEVVFDP